MWASRAADAVVVVIVTVGAVVESASTCLEVPLVCLPLVTVHANLAFEWHAASIIETRQQARPPYTAVFRAISMAFHLRTVGPRGRDAEASTRRRSSHPHRESCQQLVPDRLWRRAGSRQGNARVATDDCVIVPVQVRAHVDFLGAHHKPLFGCSLPPFAVCSPTRFCSPATSLTYL